MWCPAGCPPHAPGSCPAGWHLGHPGSLQPGDQRARDRWVMPQVSMSGLWPPPSIGASCHFLMPVEVTRTWDGGCSSARLPACLSSPQTHCRGQLGAQKRRREATAEQDPKVPSAPTLQESCSPRVWGSPPIHSQELLSGGAQETEAGGGFWGSRTCWTHGAPRAEGAPSGVQGGAVGRGSPSQGLQRE